MPAEAAGAPGRPPRSPVSTGARIREVFSTPAFRRFFGARAVSQFGDGVFQLAAAAVLLFENPGPNPVVDLLAVISISLIPFSAVGPFAGVFIDRWERRKILTRVPILRAAVAALAPAAALLGSRGVAFYAVVLVVLSANRFFLATMSTVLPQLVPADDLLVANSVATTGGSIANVLGQTLGFGLSQWIGGSRTGLVAAVAFVASAVAVRGVPAPAGFVPKRGRLLDELRDVMGEMVGGLRAVRRAPRAVYALAAVSVVQVLVGVITGVIVYHFIRVLGLDVQAGLGVLGVLAFGIGVGVVAVPIVARAVRYDLLIPIGLLVAACGTAITGVRLTVELLYAGTILVGVSYAFAKIPVDTIVQEEMADQVRGRAFAVYDVLFNVARVVGVAIAAAAYAAGASSRGVIQAVAVAYVAAGAAFAAWERRVRRASAPPKASG